MPFLWVESGARKLRNIAIIVRAKRGKNPRQTPPKIRFRNLLCFNSLTNQFNIIFTPIWDNFGTLFAPKITNFFQ